jgi:hypothetical protein
MTDMRIGGPACGLLALGAVASDAGTANKTPLDIGGLTYYAQNAGHEWSLNLKGDPACLYRFEVRAGDQWVQEKSANAGVERSELQGPTDDSDPARFNSETWTAYQFRIEPGVVSAAKWVVLGDWHVRPDPGDVAIMSSPWQLELRQGDVLVFDIRISDEKPVRDVAPERHIYTAPGPIARGVWHSLVSDSNFDWRPQGNGGVTVWLDGKQIVNYHGPFGYDTTLPPYFKFGIYRSAAPETIAVDYTNVVIARHSLAARIQDPPSICARK